MLNYICAGVQARARFLKVAECVDMGNRAQKTIHIWCLEHGACGVCHVHNYTMSKQYEPALYHMSRVTGRVDIIRMMWMSRMGWMGWLRWMRWMHERRYTVSKQCAVPLPCSKGCRE